MLARLRGSALALLSFGLWSACTSESAPSSQIAGGEAGDATAALGGNDASGGADSALGGSPVAFVAGAAGAATGEAGAAGGGVSNCGPIAPPHAWASWRMPDPANAGGAGGATDQRYTLTDETAIDAVTGLEWQRRAAPEQLDWRAATEYCACLSVAGHDDWTLPSRLELVSIVDDTRQNPALDEQAFPDTPFEWFWSASPLAEASERYWYVAFWDGNTHAGSVDQLYWTRCVRQSASSKPAYDLSAPGTAADPLTELTWARTASADRVTWDEANRACAALDLQGKGWRLPSMKELQTLVDESRVAPAIDAQAFPATPSEGFWATPLLFGSTNSAWFVSFDDGIAYNALTTHLYRYRCVR